MPRHIPIHPENPCRYGVPAKIWELLRRNEEFINVVNGCIHEIDRAGGSSDDSSIRHRDRVHQVLAEVEQKHPIYGIALTWMLPEVIYQYVKANGDIGEGTVPSLNKMTWHPGSTVDGSGWLMPLGPTIRSQENDLDKFAEWGEYLKKHGHPSLKRSWNDLPSQLQREIGFKWAYCRLEDNGPWDTVPMETDFFSLNLKHLFELEPSAGLDEEGLSTMYQFNETKDNYRVFCFPKNVGATAAQIREVFKGWADNICESQTISKAELFGTPVEWDAFLYFEEEFSEYNSLCLRDGGHEKSPVDGEDLSLSRDDRRNAAISHAIEMVHMGGVIEGQGEEWESHCKNYRKYIEEIYTPYTQSGLVNRIYPNFNMCLTC